MLYTSLTFQLTNKCNASCKMCCESSNLHSGNKLDKDLIIKSIKSIKDIKNIKIIAITGGEPFLYVDELLKIAEEVNKINRLLSVSTNALWCKTYKYTYDIMSYLKKNNLATCLISTDAFHDDYVPAEYVKTFLNVCTDLNIVANIQTVTTKSSFARTDEIIYNLGISKNYSAVQFSYLYPVGSAKKHIPIEDFFTKKLEKTTCNYQGILFIASDGSSIADNSFFTSSIPIFSILSIILKISADLFSKFKNANSPFNIFLLLIFIVKSSKPSSLKVV